MELSRRGFVAGVAGAVAYVAGGPASRAAGAGPADDWGFTLDGGLYHTGHGSLTEAMEAARAHAQGAPFSVARTARLGYSAPSEAGELVVDQLLNGYRPGHSLADWVACANEEADYEGDFSDACHRAERADPTALDVPARAAVTEALVRAGVPDVAATYAAGGKVGDLDEAVYDALAGDGVLSARLDALVDAFVRGNGLDRDLNGLTVWDVTEHPAAVPPAPAAELCAVPA